jgi:hypothetical protein
MGPGLLLGIGPGLLLGIGRDAVRGINPGGILVMYDLTMLPFRKAKNNRLLRTDTVNVSSGPPSQLEGASQYALLLLHPWRILPSSVTILVQSHLCLLSGWRRPL